MDELARIGQLLARIEERVDLLLERHAELLRRLESRETQLAALDSRVTRLEGTVGHQYATWEKAIDAVVKVALAVATAVILWRLGLPR